MFSFFSKNTQIDHKKLRYGCYDRKFLPIYLTDLSNYQCQLNRGVLNEPVIDDKKHRFCKICIQSYLQQTKYCPVDINDKHKIKKQSLRLDEQSKRLVQILKNKCQNSSHGCEYNFTFRDYSQYLQHKSMCPRQYINCTENNCPAKFYRQDYNQHIMSRCNYVIQKCKYCDFYGPRHQHFNHKQTCKQWPLVCKNQGCKNQIKRKLLLQHISTYCPYTEVLCKKQKCQTKYLRKYQVQHIKVCQYSDQICQYCKITYQKCNRNLHLSSCPQFPLNCKNIGCEQILQRRLLQFHMNQKCPMKPIICPSQDCGLNLLLKQKSQHLLICQNHKLNCQYCKLLLKRKLIPTHLDTCPQFPITCLNQQLCNDLIIRCKIAIHRQVQCGYTTISCKYQNSGCLFKSYRINMPNHQQQCQYRPHPCNLCNIIMPFITIQDHIETTCLEHSVRCTQQCQAFIKRKLMNEHFAIDCPQTLIYCQYLQYNCKHTFKRKLTQIHLKDYILHHHTLVLKLTFGLKQDVKNFLINQQKMQKQIYQLKNMIGTNNLIASKVLDLQKKIEMNVQNLNIKTQRINQEQIKIIDQQRFRGKQMDRMEDYHLQERKQINNLQNTLMNVHKSVKQCDSAIAVCKHELHGIKQDVNAIYHKVKHFQNV